MRRQRFWRPVLGATALVIAGCTTPTAEKPPSDDRLAGYIELVLPARIEIQRYLTKPVSVAGDGSADALEVILAAYDAGDDLTKVVGTLHFELQTRRPGDRIGTRVAFWPVEINSDKTMYLYWDHLSRYYDFPLQLERPLQPGQYVLIAWLHLPTGRRLFDEYEFTYDGSSVGPLRVR